MTGPRRLAALARSANYDQATLAAIAEATFPDLNGNRIATARLPELLDAVETVHGAGLDAATVHDAIAASRETAMRLDTRWRDVFWTEVLRRNAENDTAPLAQAA